MMDTVTEERLISPVEPLSTTALPMSPMDIIFSNKSTVTKVDPDGVHTEGWKYTCHQSLLFVYTHVNGFREECRLIPIQCTRDFEYGSFSDEFLMYALESDITKKFVGKTLEMGDPEIHAVNTLMNMDPSNRCKVIQARIIIDLDDPADVMTLMPLMDGDLDDDLFDSMMDEATPDNRKMYISTIMASIDEQLKCLNSAGLIYTDIKPENTFFSYDHKSHALKVQLGDLGSCGRPDSEDFITTLPCFQGNRPLVGLSDWSGHTPDDHEMALQCQKEIFGALLIYLFMRFIKQDKNIAWWSNLFTQRLAQRNVTLIEQYHALIVNEMPDLAKYISRTDVVGKYHDEIKLDFEPAHIAIHGELAYVAHSNEGYVTVMNMRDKTEVDKWYTYTAGGPSGVVVHEGLVYFSFSDCVEVFELNGDFHRSFFNYGNRFWQLNSPSAIAISNDNSIYVCDTGNDRVQVFGLDGLHKRSIGSYGSEPGQFRSPVALAVDTECVYVYDRENDRVQVFGLNGTYQRMWVLEGTGADEFKWTRSIGTDVSIQGKLLYLVDVSKDRVQVYEKDTGTFVRTFGSTGRGEGQFFCPVGVAFTDDNKMCVTDSQNKRIQIFL